MSEHVRHVDDSTVVITGPIHVKVVLTIPGALDPTFEIETTLPLFPGDHVRWDYPEEGLTVTIS